jgi:uncharacterized protein (DUF302 family)
MVVQKIEQQPEQPRLSNFSSFRSIVVNRIVKSRIATLSQLTLALFLSATTLPVLAESAASAAQLNPRAVVTENVSHADFNVTLKTLKEQLAHDGWTLLTEIDLAKRLATKNVIIPGGMVILELTSGGNTVALLKNEDTRYIAGLMPCSVSVYGMSDGRVIISRMNAGMLTNMLEPRVAEVMAKSAAKLDTSIANALAKISK